MKTILKKLTSTAALALIAGASTNAFSQMACNDVSYNMQTSSVINCTGYLYDSGGPGNPYGSNEDYTFIISPIDATSITIKFLSFNLQSTNDWLEIYNTTTGSPYIYHYTGTTLPTDYTTTGTNAVIRIKFHSNATTQNAGFHMVWSSVGGSCGSEYNGSASVISAKGTSYDSGGKAGNYSNNESKTFNIEPTNATTVCLSFASFRTEANYDYLSVFDGINGGGNPLGTFSGNTLPSNITSSSGKMSIIFTSDGSVVDTGWRAFWDSDGDYPAFAATQEARTITSDDATEQSGVTIFPNPANASVAIDFNVKQEGAAKIVVYNAAGMEMIVLNESLPTGKHTVNFDTSSLSNGVYFCKVITADNVQIEKLVKN